jgi:hypothetical protein
MNQFLISKKSIPRKCLTVKGALKAEYEWVQIEGVPCQVMEEIYDDEGLYQGCILNSFTSNPESRFKVAAEELEEHFEPAVMDKQGFILGLQKYPDGKIHNSEFKKRADVQQIASVFKRFPNKDLASKLEQTLVSQGSTHAATIPLYLDYMSGAKKLKSTENFGDPIFNRHKRWCPPIDISFEEFKASPSYPAPIGVRPKDFCLPSEIISSAVELAGQMCRFLNSDRELTAYLQTNILTVYGAAAQGRALAAASPFCCKWCNKVIDANCCKAEYKSATNYIEICHRDPNDRFLPRNVYWGHGDCNRRQGGYTEEDRIQDAMTLLKYNPEYLKKYAAELAAILPAAATA